MFNRNKFGFHWIVRSSLVALLILGLVISVGAYWHLSVRAAHVAAAKNDWNAILEQADTALAKEISDSTKPVDEYFDNVAIPHIPDFLADFTGLFYDTPRFVYKWLADKVQFRSYSGRINDQVEEALNEHLKFPGEFNAAIQESFKSFHVQQQQNDAKMRDRAYALLEGAGVNVDKATLDELLRKASETSRTSAFETIAQDSAIDFGSAMAGKEVSMIALQSLIIERVMVTIGTRMGVLTVGAGAAGTTAGAGTATGVGAVPSWGLAAGEIGLAVIIDLAAGWWLESKAQATMQTQLNDIRAEIHRQLDRYMREYSKNLRKQRVDLMDVVLSQKPGF